jgi:uncharacterized membrane protein YebE (DUF533 family)
MADARDLLGQLLQAGTTRSASSRIGNAFGQGSGAGGNPLSELLGGLLGGGSGGGNLLSDLLGGSGGAGGAGGTARDMLGGASRVAQQNPLAVGGLAALAGAFLGGRTSVPHGALGGGALALLASLALASLKGPQAAQAAPSGAEPAQDPQDPPLGLREPQTPGEEQQLQDKASLMISAMISAAKADGAIDASEVQRTVGKLEAAGSDPQTRQLITDEMLKPLDIDALIARARTPQLAAEVYAASLLAIEVDTPAERDYLRRLADGLHLDPATVQRLHQTLGVTV